MTMAKRRIAILGGGVGSLSTAYALTATPELRERYEVTVYSMGWRLGGKGATGRRCEEGGASRVEEHGLHVWLGFYENSFAMLRQTYEEMRERGLAPDSPFQSWRDALKPESSTPIGIGEGATFWDFEWPTNSDTPGEGGVFLSPLGALTEALSLLEHLFRMVVEDEAKACLRWFGGKLRHPPISADAAARERYHAALSDWHPEHPAHQAARQRGLHSDLAGLGARDALKHARTWLRALAGGGEGQPRAHLEDIAGLMTASASAVGTHVRARSGAPSPVHLLWQMLELAAAMFRGLINPEYGILEDWDLNRIDGYELLEWLAENGAPPEVTGTYTTADLTAAKQPALRSLYDLAFAYEKTADRQVANFAAGTALRVILRTTATYKQAVLFEMQSGMGEVIVSPLYLVLKDRGVRFELFRKVKRLELSEDRRLVQRVHMDRQVDYVDGEYDPIFFSSQGIPCWPAEPFWNRIVDGEAMKTAGVDWESAWNSWPAAGTEVIELGEHFDDVVLGITLGAFKKLNDDPSMCDELMAASDGFRAMAEGLGLVPTEATQLWMTRTLKRLGWRHAKPAAVGAVEPVDIWADMSQVLAFEGWPDEGGPRSLHYLCGPLNTWDFAAPSSDVSVPERARARVRALLVGWLEKNAGDLWPDAAKPGGGFDWDVLFAPGVAGEARLDAQYLRPNVDPSECCVTSVKGSTRVRLWADQSGFANLYLSGDWARSGLNTAGVESAVMAGLEASRAISGHPEVVVGGTFMQARER
jgi:uncharacterized protein with NAD-binding domain and iron-sulfur cluster